MCSGRFVTGFLFCVVVFVGGCSESPYGSLPKFEQMSAAEIDNLIETGLTAWQTSGRIDSGASCSGCHAPDGFDLAYIDYNDFHIRRRGAMHVGGEGSQLNASRLEDIVSMIHAIRNKYNITPEEPLEYRPFQPGGQVLPGETYDEREIGFLTSLQKKEYRFATIPVLSREEAFLQKEEWLSLDPEKIRVGIPFGKWSEDPFYSESVFLLADWLPALAVLPKTGNEHRWFSLQNQYVRTPSDANLKALFQEMEELTDVTFDGAGSQLMLHKYKAVLLAQHRFRIQASAGKERVIRLADSSILTWLGEDSFSEISKMAYQLRNQERPDLPDHLIQRYQLEDNKNEQLAALQHSFFLISWLVGRLTVPTQTSDNTGVLHLLQQPGFTDDYPIHYTYLLTKSAVESLYSIGSDSVQSVPRLMLPPVLVNVHLLEAKDPHQILFFENSWRMFLLLFLDLTDGHSQGYPPEIVANWTESIFAIETAFQVFNSKFADYNLELIRGVRSRLNSLNSE